MDSKCVFSFIFIAFCGISDCRKPRTLSPFIKDFDFLNYDIGNVHRRLRRAISEKNHFEMEFAVRGRPLKVKLRPDRSIFTSDAKIQSASGKPLDFDEESLVEGSVVGDMRSHVFGAFNDGVFQGKISTGDDEYYVDPLELYGVGKHSNYHSVIYSSKDVDFDGVHRLPGKRPDVADEITKFANRQAPVKRSRRATTPAEIRDSHCVLSVYADSYFVKLFDNKPSNAIFQITQQVRAVKAIYERNFNSSEYYSPKGLSFRVKKLVVYDPETDAEDPLWKAVAPNNIGIDTLLDIFSTSPFSHRDICEAFLFTDRDFEGGILGLAWIGEPNKAGGICDRERAVGNNKMKSYNTGVVTMRLYGRFTPPKVSEVTFAHELGHGFGSQHDPDTKECAPGGVKGNFIMFSKATSGDRPNNNKFSNCSRRSIKANVDNKRKDQNRPSCFISDDKLLCGNKVVEKGEQCDCGDEKTCKETCCNPAGKANECRLSTGSQCSPSQGPCCGPKCRYLANNVCRNVTDCTLITLCGGTSFSCPEPEAKEDTTTECADGLKVCLKGECKVSVCEKYALQECRCSKEGEECDLCCQEPDKPSTCQSAKRLQAIPSRLRDKKMIPGTPCADLTGYCDVFHVCRKINMEGPLLRLTKRLLTVEGLKQTVQKYWWAILIGVIVLVVLVILMVKVCAVYTPSSNPRKRRHKPLPGRKKKNPRGSQGQELQPRA